MVQEKQFLTLELDPVNECIIIREQVIIKDGEDVIAKGDITHREIHAGDDYSGEEEVVQKMCRALFE
jgi:hypothetical protein